MSSTIGVQNIAHTNGTVAATVSSGGVVTFNNAGPAFSAYMTNGSAGISTGSTTSTKIILDTEEFDTNNCFDSTTNYRFTPTVAGYYQINGAVTLAVPATTGGAAAQLYKNGTNFCIGAASGTANLFPTAFVGSLIYFNGSSDYIELYIYNGAGTTTTTGYGRDQCYMNGYLARNV